MLAALSRFFQDRVRSSASGVESGRGVQLATGALLLEMARADFAVQDVERAKVAELLRLRFGLSEEETSELVALSEQASRESVSLHEFTQLINGQFSQDQKSQVIRLLWDIAFADSRLDKYEEHLVRKIADLLYVPHSEFIRAKLAAQEASADESRRDDL
ncbi:MAG: tellurite resistance TerB family protein [Gammaproteobacteria bacterium]|nr:TerB family tellurite resistance protein [Gammaproteobacteria bacterium]